MKVKADLHNHFSTFENIGEVFDKAMDIAYRNLGARGIFGVINAQDKGLGRYETFLKQGGKNAHDLGNAFYVPSIGIYVVKGQEVFTQGGHILALGLNYGVRLKDYRTLKDSLKEARDQDAVIILDHPCFLDGVIAKNPYDYRKYFQEDWIDGIEVHNGEAWLPIMGYYPANKKAQRIHRELCNEFDIGAISTSDGHSIREIATSSSEIEQPDFSSPERLRESLRKSIREHKDFSQDRQANAYSGTLNHAGKIAIARLASRLGLIGRIN